MAAPAVTSGVRPNNYTTVTIVVGLDVIDRDMTRPLVKVYTVTEAMVRHNAILGPTIGVVLLKKLAVEWPLNSVVSDSI